LLPDKESRNLQFQYTFWIFLFVLPEISQKVFESAPRFASAKLRLSVSTRKPPEGGLTLVLPDRDSNPNTQDQNLVSYH
jgi:hypothetical protein